MIGDIGADVRAATAAGAIGVLVPTPVTLPTRSTGGTGGADLSAAVPPPCVPAGAAPTTPVGARGVDAGVGGVNRVLAVGWTATATC